MALVLVTAPAVEPISTADAKSHLRVDISDDDTYIDTLVAVARRTAERISRHALITQTWDLLLDAFPAGDVLEIPLPPLQSVTYVQYTDDDGNTSTFAASSYQVDAEGTPGRIALDFGETWPADMLQTVAGVRVRFVAGFGDAASDVPEDIIHAMKLMIGHWYENREDVTVGAVAREIPKASEFLLANYRELARSF